MKTTPALAACLLFAACRPAPAPALWPAMLQFDTLFAGQSAARVVECQGGCEGVRLDPLPAPFGASLSGERLVISFAPAAPGDFRARVVVHGAGDPAAELTLIGMAEEAPDRYASHAVAGAGP